MKLIRSILALIVFVGFSFSMTAQNVTINKSQVTLETVLDDLSRQTGFEFLHSRPTVNPDEIVSLNVSGVSLETALQKLFSNKPIGYEIKDSKVYLIAKDTPDTPKKDEKVVVTGTTIAECTDAYVKKLKQNNINIKVDIEWKDGKLSKYKLDGDISDIDVFNSLNKSL